MAKKSELHLYASWTIEVINGCLAVVQKFATENSNQWLPKRKSLLNQILYISMEATSKMTRPIPFKMDAFLY